MRHIWAYAPIRPLRRCIESLDASAILIPMQISSLGEFIARYAKLFILTGAGCSTDSGIPDYRDANGSWKRSPPVTFQAFMSSAAVRQRYWARSLIGWERFRRAAPNKAHEALARLERQRHLSILVTQNVDGLHQAAGSREVIDLHGRLDQVRCMDCESLTSREKLQAELLRRNPAWSRLEGALAPDGDADLDALPFHEFVVPACARCGGVLKPDVVFFGESVPHPRVEAAMHGLERADAVLVIGSSLMLYSGYRFVLAAAQSGKPVAAVNLGLTRADDLLTLKVPEPCAQALAALSLPVGESSGFVQADR
jgi:NAD-dependent SIR2 family protein deacetylase